MLAKTVSQYSKILRGSPTATAHFHHWTWLSKPFEHCSWFGLQNSGFTLSDLCSLSCWECCHAPPQVLHSSSSRERRWRIPMGALDLLEIHVWFSLGVWSVIPSRIPHMCWSEDTLSPPKEAFLQVPCNKQCSQVPESAMWCKKEILKRFGGAWIYRCILTTLTRTNVQFAHLLTTICRSDHSVNIPDHNPTYFHLYKSVLYNWHLEKYR